MNNETARQEAKTAQKRFLQMLEREFEYSPKEAQAILEEAEAYLAGRPGQFRPGQMRVTLIRYDAGHGQGLSQTAMQEVVWTIDAGSEDRAVLQADGPETLRRVRIQRLLSEALEQGAIATQEDLATVLHVSVRTIKRDCAVLAQAGVYLPTRGNMRGIGRGQTHKAQIIGRWLSGETYDQLSLRTHHTASSISRYVQAFIRVVDLHLQGFAESQIALLLQMGQPLVREYLAVYNQHDAPVCRQRLEEQRQRLLYAPEPHRKKGAR
jgi:hypothetical protein